jgi:hypothetical protein
MRRFTLLIYLFIILASCSIQHIQVFDTGTTNTELKDNYFVYETDSLQIKYYFWEDKGILGFSVFNKLNKPIFIDWKNSSFIYNDDKLNYWNENETEYTTSIYKGLSYRGRLILPGYTLNEGINESTTLKVKPERITFIPPKSNYYKSSFYLLRTDNYPMGNSKDSIVPRNDNTKRKTTMRIERFNPKGSPIRFRNFLALSLNENFQQVFYVDNEFYVSAIKEMDYRHFRGKTLRTENERILYEKPFKKITSFYTFVKKQQDPYGW